jgi:hypothetical protein
MINCFYHGDNETLAEYLLQCAAPTTRGKCFRMSFEQVQIFRMPDFVSDFIHPELDFITAALVDMSTMKPVKNIA